MTTPTLPIVSDDEARLIWSFARRYAEAIENVQSCARIGYDLPDAVTEMIRLGRELTATVQMAAPGNVPCGPAGAVLAVVDAHMPTLIAAAAEED